MERLRIGRKLGIAALAAVVASAACGDAFTAANQPATDAGASAGAGGAGATGGASGSGAAAGGGGSAGQAHDCTVASDCQGQDSDCGHRTCTSGKCGFEFVTVNTPVLQQTHGDCIARVCDGSGGVKDIFDDSDVFDDGNACTTDRCSSGTSLHDHAAPGTPCGTPPMACDSEGKCVGCKTASDCGTDLPCVHLQCNSGTCSQQNVPPHTQLPDSKKGDCHHDECGSTGTVVTVVDDADLPAPDGNLCTEDTCSNGVPFPVEPDGTKCGSCLMCDAGTCTDCPGATYFCVNPSQSCVPRKDPGETCANAAECASGNCRNQLCCAQPCDSQCQECSANGLSCQKMESDNSCQDSSKACFAQGTCTCANGAQDQGETDVDCGGPCAPLKKCTLGKLCGANGGINCTTGVCCPCGSVDTCKPSGFDCNSC